MMLNCQQLSGVIEQDIVYYSEPKKFNMILKIIAYDHDGCVFDLVMYYNITYFQILSWQVELRPT